MRLPRVAAPSLAPRVHGSAPWPGRIPADPEPRARRKRQVRRAGPIGPPPAAAAGRPGGPAPPPRQAPRRSLLQPDFLFAASRPRLTSRAGKPPKAASFSETPPPAGLRLLPPRIPPRAWEPARGRRPGRGKPAWPAGGTARAPLPGTRGRCAAVGGRRLLRGLAAQPFSVPGPEGTSRGRGRRAGVRCWS